MSFGFGANPYQMSSQQISQQGIDLARAQAPERPDSAGGEEAVAGVDAFTGIAQGQKGLREVIEGVKKGKEAVNNGVQHVINGVQNASNTLNQRGVALAQNARNMAGGGPRSAGQPGIPQDGFNHGPLLGKPGSEHEMGDMSSGGTKLEDQPTARDAGINHPQIDSKVPSAEGTTVGGQGGGGAKARPTPSGNSATDADGNPHSTPSPRSAPDMPTTADLAGPSGPVPKMNAGTIMNGTAGDAQALAGQTADAVQGGMNNLHAKVQSGLDKIGELTSKVDAGLDTGISTAEGVLDAMGPIGDVAGLFTGIYGAIKAHHDKVEEEEHVKSVQQGISQVAGSANIPNTNVANIGKQTAGVTSQLQNVSAHF